METQLQSNQPQTGAGSLFGFAQFPDEVVEPFTRLAARAMAAPIAAVFLRQGDRLILRCGSGLPEMLKTQREIPNFFAAGQTVPPRLTIDDIRNSSLTQNSEILQQLAFNAIAVLQFSLENGTTALLCVADVQPRAWTSREADVLTETAGMIVLQVRREMRARTEASRQRMIEEAKRQSEERYRRLFESSRDAIYMTTRDGTFVDANSSMLELFGYTRQEFLQLNASQLYASAADRTRYQKEIDKIGSVRQHEIKLKRKDGVVLDCLKTATVQRADDGSIVGYQGIIHDISARKKSEEQLTHNAFHDSLTNLPNRALFMDRLERIVRAAKRRSSYRFGVLFLDLDRFKIVNDTLGHGVGDQLLIAAARRLEGCLRSEDTVARLGGDEFAIILDSIRDAGDGTRVAERIIQEMGLPFKIDGRDVHTGTSVGVALSYSGSDVTAEGLLREADAAMYRAKTTGRGRYEVFDPFLHTEAVTQLQMESDLRRALQAREFFLVYQPVIDLQENRLAGFEAFLRWQHPSRGLVPPNEFIPVAEATGLIHQIGFWVLTEACRQIREWEMQYPANVDGLTISVNLSGKQFYQPDLIAHIDQILAEGSASPSRIKLEVSESVIMKNAEKSIAILTQLRNRGILLSIDDFGTGYSSLSYLQQFPVTTFKIERVFTNALTGEGNTGIINSILALARSMGVDALAEGVETIEQVDRLRTLGAKYAQGYHFSAPLDADKAAQFILS
ncbi:MAG TPA: EAL domain-containing protein [Longimicrobiales bacterium]|nr:EAL domain-containing protein [Longimicrobiales bacterium]